MLDNLPVGYAAYAYGLGKLAEALKEPIGDLAKPIAKMLDAKAEAFKASKEMETDFKRLENEQDKQLLRLDFQDFKDQWHPRRKRNLKAIVGNAVNAMTNPEVVTEVNDKPPMEDSIYRLIDESKDVGDPELQVLWGKMLAGEIATPGKYSLLTMSRVKTLSKQEAEMFTGLLSCIWTFDGEVRLLTDLWDYETQAEYSFANMEHILRLDAHGLVRFQSIAGVPLDSVQMMGYYGENFEIDHDMNENDEHNHIITHANLTQVGEELLGIAGGTPNHQYKREMIEQINARSSIQVRPL